MKPGQLLAAKYRLEQVLGRGTMGEVWAAVNEGTGRSVAVKLTNSPTDELRRRLLREARAVGALRHKNVVDIYDVGATETGDPFLVMERLSGETLADRLKWVGRIPPATAVEIALAIASALRAAHAKGIVHRDLKPANVFLHRDAEGNGEIVKVVDFGVSKHLEAGATTASGVAGSPAYMSPEQVKAESVDARSDLWSLGVVLFQMLAGRRPFPSDSAYRVLAEVISAPIPGVAALAPGVTPALGNVVSRCLTREVGARVQSADELIQLLRAARDDDASSETEPTTKLDANLEEATPEPREERPASAAPVPHAGRGLSKTTVAMLACAAALLLLVTFAVLLRGATP